MASIRKVKDKWLAEVRLKGLKASKTFPTKVEAQSWALQQEQQHGKHGGIIKGKTLGDAMRRYADEVSPKNKGARWEIVRLNKLCRDNLAYIALGDLCTEDLQAWVDRQTDLLSPSSINRELNQIAAVLRVCRTQWKWMAGNPMQDICRPKNPPPRDRRIAAEEVERILQALQYEEDAPVVSLRQQIAVAFLLAIETAMRQGELWGLAWERVHLEARYVMLPDTKNGTKRNVPLSRRAVKLLEKMQGISTSNVFTVSQASAEVIFRRAVQLAEIKGLTFHDTRHEALTRLARKLDVLDLARMVGHRDPRSLMIYYNATATEIAQRLD